MATLPLLPGSNTVAAFAQSLKAAGDVSNRTDLWPIQNWGGAARFQGAGVPDVEALYHRSLEQGRFLESSLGDAMSKVADKRQDLNEKIQHYLAMVRLGQDGQFSDVPRSAKYAADCISFVQKIREYQNRCLALASAQQANILALEATATRMNNMLQANMNALANLMRDICNWTLPDLASIPALIASTFHWDGFNFNSLANFSFSQVDFNFDFSLNQCSLRTGDFTSLFNNPAPSTNIGGLTVGTGKLVLPFNGTYGDPSQYNDPSYIAKMQSTPEPVFDPGKVTASNHTSLPSPATIISNYALPAAVYEQNVVSAVSDLAPVVVPQGSAVDNSGQLRALAQRFLTLDAIEESNFEANRIAAWLFYLDKNRTARGGTWIKHFQDFYATHIAPSITYLRLNPVPWNQVLGGAGIDQGPSAIPLIADIKADTTGNLKWRMSFIEAALLGYPRNTKADISADIEFLAAFTQGDLDYVATAIDPTSTATVTLGAGVATYPVECTFPESIASQVNEVIALAAQHIDAAPGYQSSRPQFRFVYDMFAQASPVDRYTQFWRDFKENLQAFLAQDSYIVAFVATYIEALAGVLDPLADPAAYNAIVADATTRNRTWKPGAALLPIPTELVMTTGSGDVPVTSSGWSGDNFDAATFLTRPDVQAQSVPVQLAMLRTNQSYASLLSQKGQLAEAVQEAISTAQTSTTAVSMPGWEVEPNTIQAVPPGAAGAMVSYGLVVFDQTGYVRDQKTIYISEASSYIVNLVSNWDPAGEPGTRTLTLFRNGTAVATASSNFTAAMPYTVQLSVSLDLAVGDLLQVQASHTLSDTQNLLASGDFMGLIDVQSVPGTGGGGSGTGGGGGSYSGTVNFTSGTAFPIYTAVTQNNRDGAVYPVSPATKVVGATPFVDGIALATSTGPGEPISVAVGYGSVYETTGTDWVAGGLLYVAGDGSLTQDYATLITKTRWIVCIGKAITPTSFLFAPHMPTNYIQNF